MFIWKKKSKYVAEFGQEKYGSKKSISTPKSSKKHNLLKWHLYSSISNSFRDISNSLNSPFSHVVKITLQILVYWQTENVFTIWKMAQKLKNMISGPKTEKKKRIKNRRKFSIKIVVSGTSARSARVVF